MSLMRKTEHTSNILLRKVSSPVTEKFTQQNRAKHRGKEREREFR